MNPQCLSWTDSGGVSRPALAVLILCGFASQVVAAETTNRADLYFASPYIELHLNTEDDTTLTTLFREMTSSDDVVFDQLGTASSRLGWIREQDRFGYNSLEDLNNDGARLFGRIGLDSLRTAAVASLPLEFWQDHWEGWFGNVLAGTIGNPEEEHLQYTSVTYSAVRSSWERANEGSGVQWGLRPWRTNPYVYVLAKAGHYEGRSLITAEGRAGYTMLGSSKLEARVALALPSSFQLAAAATTDPSRVNSMNEGSHFAVTLERLVRSSALHPTTLFFVGFRSGYRTGSDNSRQENVFIAGFSRAW